MNDLRAECIARLQTAGLRPSEPRIAVLAFLMKNRIHPVAETIYKSLAPEYPTLSRTTIYNTLKLFEENKIVMPVTTIPVIIAQLGKNVGKISDKSIRVSIA